jgi:hypothetical protein
MVGRELIFHKDHATRALHTSSGTLGGFSCLHGHVKVICVVKLPFDECLDPIKNWLSLSDYSTKQDELLLRLLMFSHRNSRKGEADSSFSTLLQDEWTVNDQDMNISAVWKNFFCIFYVDLEAGDIL